MCIFINKTSLIIEMKTPEENIDSRIVLEEAIKLLNNDFDFKPTIIEGVRLRRYVEDSINDYKRVQNKGEWGFGTDIEAVERFLSNEYGYDMHWMFHSRSRFGKRLNQHLRIKQGEYHNP
tara:strand:- start:924 stop:1283 length:360 start_codon:yes stop_codon:yes gene_type:complete